VRIFAYCSAESVKATRRAAGVKPLVCPPVTAETLDLALLEGNDLIYLNLHSLSGVGALLGSVDGPPVALRADQLEGLDLGGAVVFAESCYLGDAKHPMRRALLDAGARAVVAGAGKNWGSESAAPKGADVLGLWLRRGLQAGMGLDLAFRLAKIAICGKAIRSKAARDALAFRIFRG
jgi:hypothetical protein